MRILHTADWHLGRRLNRVHRLDEQRAVLESLVDCTRKVDPDVVVLAGDVFDVFTPGAAAERLYYRTVQALAGGGRRAVLVVAGNHDSPARLTAPRTLLEEQGIFTYGDPHDPGDVPGVREHEGFSVVEAGPGWLTLEVGAEQATFHLLPFPSRARLPSRVDQEDASATEIVEALASEVPDREPVYLVSHLYVAGGHDVEQDRDDYLGGAYAVDPVVLEGYEAAFLGHLHTAFGTSTWRYAGAPLAFDFDDPDVDRGAWLHDDGDWRQIPLEGAVPLREEPVTSVDQALALADEKPQAWIRLRFDRGTVVERQQRERIREAFGKRLVDIRFEAPDVEPSQKPEAVELGDLDPETAFRRYVEDADGAHPDEELVELFLEVLEPQDADDDQTGEGGIDPGGTEQASLEVEG